MARSVSPHTFVYFWSEAVFHSVGQVPQSQLKRILMLEQGLSKSDAVGLPQRGI